MEAGLSDHAWSIAEICDLLPESHTVAAQIDKALILKALGEKPTSLWKS